MGKRRHGKQLPIQAGIAPLCGGRRVLSPQILARMQVYAGLGGPASPSAKACTDTREDKK
jgi:hypothetical protein